MPVKPYTLKQAQALVKDAKSRAERRHSVWRALELLYRRGEVHDSLVFDDVPSLVWEEFPNLTLSSINLILPNAQMVIANAMAHDPAFLVEPHAGGDEAEQEAKVGEHLLRYFWQRTEGTDTFRSMTQDMVFLGSGLGKVGWSFVEEEVERDEADMVEELIRLQDADLMDADLAQRPPRSTDALAEAMELTEPRVIQDEPFLKYVSPYDFFVERRARRLSEARWVAERLVMPVDEIEANENFDPEAVEALVHTYASEDRPRERAGEEDAAFEGGASSEFDEGTDPFAEATVYEFYDVRNRRLLVFQEDAEKPLFDGEWPYSHRHLPYVQMRNFEDGDRFWSFGDLENVASIQSEFNQYIFEQMSSARRSGNKYVVDEQAWTDELRKLLESEKSDVAAPIKLPQSKTIEDVFKSVQRQPVSAEIFQGKHDLADHLRDVLGISELQAGLGLGDRASATEAAVMDGNASLRAADKKYQVENAASGAGLRFLLLCQEFLDEEFALRIVDADGVPQWLNVSKEELRGEYRVSVTSGSTMAVNPATRMARALDVMTQIIPALVEAGYDPHPLWRQALRDYGLDPDRMLKRLPMQQAPVPAEGEALPGSQPTVPQEELGGPPVPAAVEGDMAI